MKSANLKWAESKKSSRPISAYELLFLSTALIYIILFSR